MKIGNLHIYWKKKDSSPLESRVNERTQALQRTKEHLLLAMRAAKMGTWERDLRTSGATMSPTMTEVLGLDPGPDQVSRENFLNMIHPDDREIVLSRTQASIKSGVPFHAEFRFIRPDGKQIWLMSVANPVRDEKGEISELIGVAIDITEKKENERLIEEQRLKMMASAKLSALGEMAGGIAHEINNPLTVVHGNAGLLKTLVSNGNPDPAQLYKIGDRIEKTAIRISGIVKSLRALSGSDEKMSCRAVNLNAVFSDALELCREKFKNHGVKLEIEPFSESLTLRCHPGQISQVLLNLLNNAFDAVENLKSRWIRVKVTEGRDFVDISVTDSGQGIAPEIREKIMQPFFTTKEAGKGTGLGLSISRALVEEHHGELWIDSKSPNTRFVVRLPNPPAPPTARTAGPPEPARHSVP